MRLSNGLTLTKAWNLVGITANTPAAPHAYGLARAFRRRGVAVVIGGPHATLLPDEVAQHADQSWWEKARWFGRTCWLTSSEVS